MNGSASVAWLALLVSLCAIALLFWRPADLPFSGSAPVAADAEPVAAATPAEATPIAEPKSSADAAELSTRLAALEDVLPDVTDALERERALNAQSVAEREQLRALYEQTIQDSVLLATLDIEPLLDQAQALLADGSPIQAPISLMAAARDRAARAASPRLQPLLDALDKDRAALQVIAQRSVRKAADDLHRLALGLDALPLQPQAGSAAPATPAIAPLPTQDKSGTDQSDPSDQSGWLDRLVKSSSELIELPEVARSDQVLRVTEVGASDLGVLPPAASYYLVENLRLRLLSARLSLLLHDRPGFDSDRQRAVQWLRDHFDLTDDRTRQSIELLESLESVGRASVDISLVSSREALENLAPAEPSR